MICETIKLHDGRDDVTLTTYIIDKSSELTQSPRAAVLVCPGGAYRYCSDREGEPLALAFNAMGYHAFVLRYSVYDEGGEISDIDPAHDVPAKDHCLYPGPMIDIAKAMLLIKENADEWHIDKDKIATCGCSAGGHNCAMYSVYWNKSVLTERLGVNAHELRPAANILCYPVTDLISIDNNFIAYKIMRNILLGSSSPSAGAMLAASPTKLVDKDTPPTFIWSTFEDVVVPVEQSLDFARALKENGVPFEMHIFEGGQHGLSLATQSSSASKEWVNSDASHWTSLCERWLFKRLALEID